MDESALADTAAACNALIDTRYSDDEDHGAAAMLLADGTILTGTAPDAVNPSVEVCHEIEPYCGAYRLNQPIVASVCLHRQPGGWSYHRAQPLWRLSRAPRSPRPRCDCRRRPPARPNCHRVEAPQGCPARLLDDGVSGRDRSRLDRLTKRLGMEANPGRLRLVGVRGVSRADRPPERSDQSAIG